MKWFLLPIGFCISLLAHSQSTYIGVDLSYVNEMEACGVEYKENNIISDPFQIFANHNCNLARFRLWHTPSWYDNLNSGNRYSDLNDVKISIQRAIANGMEVLLAYHLSDNWADPGKQIVPAAWAGVVNDLEVLKDSLYNYIYGSLFDLHQIGLLPEMVQIGNETNRGILLSQAVNDAGWTLDWSRNSQLFNSALQAVTDMETLTGQDIRKAIHIADPASVDWYISNFISNGVTDFDVIGISYYYQWHGSTTFAQLGTIIDDLVQDYARDVMIFETGYPWTSSFNDNADNILSSAHSGYSPLSPANQKQWLIDLTEIVFNNGGKGVIYWEPAWVSSDCFTQWAQGSHYENAAFYDFQSNLLADGGIAWMDEFMVTSVNIQDEYEFEIRLSPNHGMLIISGGNHGFRGQFEVLISNLDGKRIIGGKIDLGNGVNTVQLPDLPQGIYLISLLNDSQRVFSTLMPVFQD